MKFMVIFLLTLVLPVVPAFSHGISVRLEEDKALMVAAEFDDGEPVSYAEVEIYLTGEALPFQTGFTDRNGRFLFHPDKAGEWQVIVNDGMGHRQAVTTKTGANLATPGSVAPRPVPVYLGIVIGISLIFGFSGLVVLVRHRTRRPSGNGG